MTRAAAASPETRALDIRLAPGSAAGELEGLASVFGEVDAYGDVMAPGCFAKSLARHAAAGTRPVLLWSHNPSQPVGVWTEIRETERGLSVKGRLVMETARGREVHALLKAGAATGLSIGFFIRHSDRQPDGQRGRIIREVDLVEISLVAVPAAPRARVENVRTAAQAADETEEPMEDDDNDHHEERSEQDFETRLAEVETRFEERVAAIETTATEARSAARAVETRLRRPTTAAATNNEPPIEQRAWRGFIRRGAEALQADEVRSLRVNDDTAGGYLAPENFVAEVIKQLVQFSPVRQAARVGNTASSSVVLPKRTGTPTAAWVSETGDTPETQSTYGQLEIPVHEARCYVDVSQRLLEDAAVNIEDEVSSDLAEEFGRLEGVAFLNGDGAGKPAGILSSAELPNVASGQASTLNADSLITAYYALPAPYRASATWMLNSATLAIVRKLKDTSGAYLWQPALAAGQPETLLGRPVIDAPDMPEVAAGKLPILVGDFSAAYRIYDRVSLAVMRDPFTVATKGLVRFHARRRVGGGMVLGEALRALRIASS